MYVYARGAIRSSLLILSQPIIYSLVSGAARVAMGTEMQAVWSNKEGLGTSVGWDGDGDGWMDGWMKV